MKHVFLAMISKTLGLAVLCGLLCSGCGGPPAAKGNTGVLLYINSGVNVPEDCQQWLVNFLDAFNAKDGAKMLELTSPKDITEYMAKAPEAARKTMIDSAVKNVQAMSQGLGDLRSCTVKLCQESAFAADAQSPGPMGAGTYFSIQGELKCSKRDAKASFKLYKKADSPEPMIGLWNFSWSPF